jgi:hypothetical protein
MSTIFCGFNYLRVKISLNILNLYDDETQLEAVKPAHIALTAPSVIVSTKELDEAAGRRPAS